MLFACTPLVGGLRDDEEICQLLPSSELKEEGPGMEIHDPGVDETWTDPLSGTTACMSMSLGVVPGACHSKYEKVVEVQSVCARLCSRVTAYRLTCA